MCGGKGILLNLFHESQCKKKLNERYICRNVCVLCICGCVCVLSYRVVSILVYAWITRTTSLLSPGSLKYFKEKNTKTSLDFYKAAYQPYKIRMKHLH